MAKVLTDDTYYKNIADTLRFLLDGEDTYKPSEMADGVTDVFVSAEAGGYNSGYEVGNTEGYAKGHEEGYGEGYYYGMEMGKYEEYNAFWDSFQSYGTARNYSSAFRNNRFNDDTFRPKYDMKPTDCGYMFAYNGYEASGNNYITDLAECLEEAGVVLDTSDCASFGYMFYVAIKVTRIPKIDATSCTHLEALFTNCHSLKTIDCLKLRDDGTNTWTTSSWGAPFQNCNSLTNITIEGTIGMSISFAASPLSAKSLVSIVEALSDTATGKTLTVKQTAVDNADWTTTDYASWDELIATKTNWAFAYR